MQDNFRDTGHPENRPGAVTSGRNRQRLRKNRNTSPESLLRMAQFVRRPVISTEMQPA